MLTETDIRIYILSKQMIDQKVLTPAEKEDRLQIINFTESQPDFNDWENRSFRWSVGIAKRRNAIYRDLLREVLGQKDFGRLERFIYHHLERSVKEWGKGNESKIRIDPRILTAKLEI